ncbi:MAG: hypothetical protein ACTTJS_06785, partial [Wolinella sp.]
AYHIYLLVIFDFCPNPYTATLSLKEPKPQKEQCMNIRQILAQKHISLTLWGKNQGFDKKDLESLKCLGSGRYKALKQSENCN